MSNSKYQEALDRVKEIYIYICDEFNLKKSAVKMNDDIEVLQELIDKLSKMERHIEQLEQALDKACKQLTHAYPFGVNKCETDAWDDSWKEWAFKNDER